MTGRRLPNADYPHEVESQMEPGDYAKVCQGQLWCCRAPNGDQGCVRSTSHKIVEHGDGTITVSPSIQFMTGEGWHGYLERGIWRSC